MVITIINDLITCWVIPLQVESLCLLQLFLYEIYRMVLTIKLYYVISQL